MTVAATFGGLQRQKINLMMHMFVAADIDDVVVITSYAPRCRSGFHWLEDKYIYMVSVDDAGCYFWRVVTADI